MLVLGSLAAGAAPAPHLRADETAKHVGEVATVCGTVVTAKYSNNTPGQKTFLNLDMPYPHHIFTIVISGMDRPAFGEPEKEFIRKRICVTGTIVAYKGKQEIVATKPTQIKLEEGK